MGYGRVAYTRGRLKLNAFVNLLDMNAPSLMMDDAATGKPAESNLKTQTYDLEFGDAVLLGAHQLLSFGGNARRNVFHITIAPGAKNRSELGGYFQDEIFAGPGACRWGRASTSSAISPTPCSLLGRRHSSSPPRVTLCASPLTAPSARRRTQDLSRPDDQGRRRQGIGLRRAASGVLGPRSGGRSVPLGPRAVGSEVARRLNPALPELKQESLTAYEAAYNGAFGRRTRFSVAAYINITNNNTNFVADPDTLNRVGLPGYHSSHYPPAVWPFPLALLDEPSPFAHIPALNAASISGRSVTAALSCPSTAIWPQA